MSASPPAGQRSLGALAFVLSFLTALWAAWHFFHSPVVDVYLLLYPWALFLGWCGEAWLHECGPAARLRQHMASIWTRRDEITSVIVLIVAGGVLRLWMVQQHLLIHGTVSDELPIGQAAWNLAHNPDPWPLYATTGGAVALYQPIAAAFLAFGASIGTLRLTLALESLALIPALYILARQFVAVPAALCATALVALAYWPAIMGVLAFGWLHGAAFQAFGMALLAYGLRRYSVTACASGGGVLALCLYSYIGHRLMPVPVALFALAFVFRTRAGRRRRYLGLLAAAFGFLVIAAPWIGAVTRDTSLWYGDTGYVTGSFKQILHQHALTAIGDALGVAGRLGMTVLANPQSNDFSVLVLPSGGLLDPLTGILVVAGVGVAVISFWRPVHLAIVSAILIPLCFASVALDFVDVYRLNSVVPALYLAAALLLQRCCTYARRLRIDTRWIVTALVIVAGGSGVANIHTALTQLSSCTVALGSAGPLNADDGEPVLIAEVANGQSARHAVFLISHPHHFPPGDVRWLYRVQPPVYDPSSGGKNPARWPIVYGPQASDGAGASFWPPRVAPGQNGVTYIMADGDDGAFLPIVRRAYPGGETRIVQDAACPSYGVTTYTVSAQQLRSPRS